MNEPTIIDRCPLCASDQLSGFHRDRRRDYLSCGRCGLVHVPARYHLTPEQEKAEYDLHRNSPDDAGYRHFLTRLSIPLMARLEPLAEGLDFGSGPGPTLSVMFEEAGHPMRVYDPFYAPDLDAFSRRYDFITATEVVEHLSRPGEVLARLADALLPGGWLGIMTKRVTGQHAFAGWHYINDPTHVAFFSDESLAWWAQAQGFRLILPGPDTALLQKLPPS